MCNSTADVRTEQRKEKFPTIEDCLISNFCIIKAVNQAHFSANEIEVLAVFEPLESAWYRILESSMELLTMNLVELVEIELVKLQKMNLRWWAVNEREFLVWSLMAEEFLRWVIELFIHNIAI